MVLIDYLDLGVDTSIGMLQELHPSLVYQESARIEEAIIGAGETCLLTELEFYVRKLGSPVGKIKAGIWNKPPASSAPLQSSTTEYNQNQITTSWKLLSFLFAGTLQLNAGSSYMVGVYVSEETSMDSSNYFTLKGYYETARLHQRYYYAGWRTMSASDIYFYLYGNLIVVAAALGDGLTWIT